MWVDFVGLGIHVDVDVCDADVVVLLSSSVYASNYMTGKLVPCANTEVQA